MDGLLILLATSPGVLTVQRYYRETHILINDDGFVDFIEEVGYISIDATISRSILMSLKFMCDKCVRRLTSLSSLLLPRKRYRRGMNDEFAGAGFVTSAVRHMRNMRFTLLAGGVRPDDGHEGRCMHVVCSLSLLPLRGGREEQGAHANVIF